MCIAQNLQYRDSISSTKFVPKKSGQLIEYTEH